ncbi:MAG TPA: protein kinase [Acidimicrobiales bacterium]
MVGNAPHIPGCHDLSLIGERVARSLFSATSDRVGRPVTVTVFPPLGDGRTRADFDRAAATAQRLGAHPSVITIHDWGHADDGRPWIVTEPQPAESVDTLLVLDGPLEVERALQVAVLLAGALETAHRAGIVHGDLSPARLVFGTNGEPLLAETGLAEFAVFPGLGALNNPVRYHAPPEVLERTEISPATDVFSLATTVYALLAGRAPQQKPAEITDSNASLLLRILQMPVPPIGRPDLPPGLEDVLRSAMSASPDKRPQQAIEVAWMLQDVQRRAGFGATEPVVLDLDEVGGPAGRRSPAHAAAPPASTAPPVSPSRSATGTPPASDGPPLPAPPPLTGARPDDRGRDPVPDPAPDVVPEVDVPPPTIFPFTEGLDVAGADPAGPAPLGPPGSPDDALSPPSVADSGGPGTLWPSTPSDAGSGPLWPPGPAGPSDSRGPAVPPDAAPDALWPATPTGDGGPGTLWPSSWPADEPPAASPPWAADPPAGGDGPSIGDLGLSRPAGAAPTTGHGGEPPGPLFGGGDRPPDLDELPSWYTDPLPNGGAPAEDGRSNGQANGREPGPSGLPPDPWAPPDEQLPGAGDELRSLFGEVVGDPADLGLPPNGTGPGRPDHPAAPPGRTGPPHTAGHDADPQARTGPPRPVAPDADPLGPPRERPPIDLSRLEASLGPAPYLPPSSRERDDRPGAARAGWRKGGPDEPGTATATPSRLPRRHEVEGLPAPTGRDGADGAGRTPAAPTPAAADRPQRPERPAPRQIAPVPDRPQPRKGAAAGPPALPVIVLIGVVIVLIIGAAWLVINGDDDADPTAERRDPAAATDTTPPAPTGVQATSLPEGLQVEWEGGDDVSYVVTVFAADRPPEVLPAAAGASIFIPDPEAAAAGRCVTVAAVHGTSGAAGTPSAPACTPGATIDAMQGA